MPDIFSPEKRSEVMSKIKGKDTKPEMVVRSALHRLGYRFRLHDRTLPGYPDIVLPKYKAVVQVRGCFWHQHSCRDGHTPKSRLSYWVEKLNKNITRDRRNDRKLRKLGWAVIVVWECHCKANRISSTIQRIDKLLNKRLRKFNHRIEPMS